MLKPIDEITRYVVAASIAIHRELGPGLLESVYETLLAGRLARDGYRVERQRPVDIVHDGIRFEATFRIDILVDNRLIIEVKSVERLSRAHGKQLLTYLRLTQQPVGLLINFAEETLKDGLRRIVNQYDPSAFSAPLREPCNREG